MTNLLRPNQREEMQSEKKVLENKMKNPYIHDKGAVNTQLRKLSNQLETQVPKPYNPNEVDSMVKKEKDLREKILNGMPSQEEMRKSPPGAVGKHMAWEKRNKGKLLAWKETRLRLEPESTDPDIANFERYRPVTNSLNMDNAHIPGKQYYLPTEAYKQGYDNVEFGVLEQEKLDQEKLQEKLEREKAWSPERKAQQAEIMKRRHAAKREEKEKALMDSASDSGGG